MTAVEIIIAVALAVFFCPVQGQEGHHRHHHHNHGHGRQVLRRVSNLAVHEPAQSPYFPPGTTTEALRTVASTTHRHHHHHHGDTKTNIYEHTSTPAPVGEQGMIHQLKKYRLRGEKKQAIRFKLSARNLPAKDHNSKSDPYVVIHYADRDEPEMVMGRTGSILNEANPTWDEVFTFPYQPTAHQRWHFIIYDRDHLGHDDLIGSVWVKVKNYVDHGQFLKLEVPTEGPQKSGDKLPLPTILIISKV